MSILRCTTSNNDVALKSGLRSGLRSVKITAFDRLHTASYQSVIVSIAQSCTIDVEKYRDLEISVTRHSRSLEIALCDRLHASFYWRSTVLQ